jgi:hypothetical protein
MGSSGCENHSIEWFMPNKAWQRVNLCDSLAIKGHLSKSLARDEHMYWLGQLQLSDHLLDS